MPAGRQADPEPMGFHGGSIGLCVLVSILDAERHRGNEYSQLVLRGVMRLSAVSMV